MPIYAYRCSACGHAQDVLRKVSDPPLNVCPSCGAPTFIKQVTAAGFQLKGSGWYVTDFRDGNKAGKAASTEPAATEGGDAVAAGSEAVSKNGEASSSDAKPANSAAAKPADGAAAKPTAAAPPPAAAPAPADKGKT